MTTDKTIYLETRSRNTGNSFQARDANTGTRVVAHYGPIEESGEDKWIAVEKIIRRLRAMHAIGQLGAEVQIPERFKNLEKFTVPAALLTQGKSDPISRSALEQANPEKSAPEKAASEKSGGGKKAKA